MPLIKNLPRTTNDAAFVLQRFSEMPNVKDLACKSFFRTFAAHFVLCGCRALARQRLGFAENRQRLPSVCDSRTVVFF